MRIFSWKRYVVLLFLCSLLLFFTASRGKRKGAGIPEVPAVSVEYYHEKSDDPGPLTTGCSSSECHPKYPHERNGSYSPFMNMHSIDFGCLVCHSVPGMNVAAVTGGERTRLEVVGMDKTIDYHKRFTKTLRCRQCHSASGEKMFEGIIDRDLPQSFVKPYPLKMLEEGSKKWTVPGL